MVQKEGRWLRLNSNTAWLTYPGATMTIHRTPILKSLASKFTVAVFLTALGTLPNASADDFVAEEIAMSFLEDLLLMGEDVDSALPEKEQSERLAATGALGIEPPQPISSAPFARSTANALASHGVLVRIAGTAGSGYCVGSSGVALDPSGKFAYMSGGIGLPGRMCGFKIDLVTQAWTPVTPPGATPVAVGSNPRGVAIEPSGRFVYVAGTNGVDGIMSGFAIDRVTGVPTPLAGWPFATGGSIPTPVVIDRSGRFMYVGQSVGSFDGSIAVFAIDATTGALSHIPGSPFPSVANGGRIAALALTPDGRFLFAGGSGLGTYEVNPVTGVPTRIAARAGVLLWLDGGPDRPVPVRHRRHRRSPARVFHCRQRCTGSGRSTAGGRPGNAHYHCHCECQRPGLRRELCNRQDLRLPHQPLQRCSDLGGRVTVCIPAVAECLCCPRESATGHSGRRRRQCRGYDGRVRWAPALCVVGRQRRRCRPGSALNATTGVFSGTLNAAGAYSFTVGVTDSLGAKASATKSIAVVGGTTPAPVTVVEFYNAVARPLLHHLRRRRDREARQRHVQGLGAHGAVVQGLRHRADRHVGRVPHLHPAGQGRRPLLRPRHERVRRHDGQEPDVRPRIAARSCTCIRRRSATAPPDRSRSIACSAIAPTPITATRRRARCATRWWARAGWRRATAPIPS